MSFPFIASLPPPSSTFSPICKDELEFSLPLLSKSLSFPLSATYSMCLISHYNSISIYIYAPHPVPSLLSSRESHLSPKGLEAQSSGCGWLWSGRFHGGTCVCGDPFHFLEIHSIIVVHLFVHIHVTISICIIFSFNIYDDRHYTITMSNIIVRSTDKNSNPRDKDDL